MEESLKNRVILILGIATIIFFIGTVNSCNNAHRNRLARDKEMVARLDLEEKINKFSQEKKAIEDKVSSLTQGLEEEKAAHQATKKALVQEQLVSQSLKEELQKVTQLKEALEEDLKEALVTGKAARSKR
jgi:chromosome segregation ATPase